MNTHQHKIALSLSAFILPGLGQLHLKERFKGWMMILLCFADIILIFGKFMMGVLVVTEKYHRQKDALSHIGKQLWEAVLLQKEWLIGGIIFLILIWLWSVWDIWKHPSAKEQASV